MYLERSIPIEERVNANKQGDYFNSLLLYNLTIKAFSSTRSRKLMGTIEDLEKLSLPGKSARLRTRNFKKN